MKKNPWVEWYLKQWQNINIRPWEEAKNDEVMLKELSVKIWISAKLALRREQLWERCSVLVDKEVYRLWTEREVTVNERHLWHFRIIA